MKTLCSNNMPFALEAFGTLGEVVAMAGRSIAAADVTDVDILAIRSTTQADRSLLEGSPVKFVGTATIGTDHMDIDYFEQAGITWCFSPGCNANSVSEYLTSSLLYLAVRDGFPLRGKTVGVVGVGNVGSRVVEKARALGMRVLTNDPPRERAGDGDLDFVSLDRLLAESDIVTLHVPLTREGPDATAGMADVAFFDRMKPGCLFVNAARGGTTDTDALLAALDSGQVANAVIDTWEGEPAFRQDLVPRVDIATPHIAGHSFEGKVMGTVMVYREACRFLNVAADWSPTDLLPEPDVPRIELDAAGLREEEALWQIVRQVYDVMEDDARFREVPSDNPAGHFDHLRKNYPMRREFRFTQVTLHNAPDQLRRAVSSLGFRL